MLPVLRQVGQVCASAPVKAVTPLLVTMLAVQQTGLVYKKEPKPDTLIKLSNGNQSSRKLCCRCSSIPLLVDP